MRLAKYNPAFMEPTERARRFGGRTQDLEELMRIVRENSLRSGNQHVLVVGPRGMGKTTLLLRVADKVREDESLSTAWFPIIASEEVYRAATIGEFWLEMVFHLHQATNDPRHERAYESLKPETDDKRLASAALGHILDFADSHKCRLILIVENLHMLFGEQLSERDCWALRETLIGEPRIMLLASAVSSFLQIESPNAPLFEQFLIHRLEPLNTDGCLDLWKAVTGESIPRQRMRALQILTGGNPRLIVILAEFASKLSLRELTSDLADLIDEHTDYLKMTTEALPALERKIFVTLAEIWDFASAAQVAKEARVALNTASAQLARLEGRGAVVARRRGRGNQYRLAERLYSIYHLMRRRGGVAARARAAAEFMASYYSRPLLMQHVKSMSEEALKQQPEGRSEYWQVIECLLNIPSLSKNSLYIIDCLPPKLIDQSDTPESIRNWMLIRQPQDEEFSDSSIHSPLSNELQKAVEALQGLEGKPNEQITAVRELLKLHKDFFPGWFILAKALRKTRQLEKALKAAYKAVEIYRSLAEKQSEIFIPDLALSLNTLGNILSELGDREGAMKATQESLDFFRMLAEKQPEMFQSDLAMVLNNMGNRLSEHGDWEGARKAAQEAVEIRRILAKKQPEIFLPHLAISLTNLGNRLSALGDQDNALKTAQEAVEIFRTLSEKQNDVYRLELAQSLNNLSNRLWKQGDRHGAFQIAKEALDIFRVLDEKQPGAFHSDLAMVLNNISVSLSEQDDQQGALKAIQEAVEISRTLAEKQPEAFRPDLAVTLNSLGIRLSEHGDPEGALKATQEAIEIYRTLVEKQPEVFRPGLAVTLNNLGTRLSEHGDQERALKATQEAIEILRVLVEKQPGAFLPYLAKSLTNLGGDLLKLGNRDGALKAMQEALEYYRKLAEKQPSAFLPDFADALNNLGAILIVIGKIEEAEQKFLDALRADSTSMAAQLGLCSLHIITGRITEALDGLRSLVDKEDKRDKRISIVIKVSIRLATTGFAQKTLEIIESSVLAPHLEPLIVALKRFLKIEVSAPPEIDEVADDIISDIEKAARNKGSDSKTLMDLKADKKETA